MLTCKTCNINKENSEFIKIKNKLYNECKRCRYDYINKYRRDINSKTRIKLNNNIIDGKKICTTCKSSKEISNFKKRNDTKQGYRNECNICLNKKMNVYYKNTYNEVRKNRKKTDPKYKLISNHRNYINKCVRKNKLIKKNKSIEYLGCDIQFLKNWLEYQFDEKMNWNNYGKYWTIDHILPLSLFEFQNNQDNKIAFNWTNLQPLVDNFSKSNKIRLDNFYNSGIKALNFMLIKNNFCGYQSIIERLYWLRKQLRYGENSSDTVLIEQMDNQQPSSFTNICK